MQPTAQQLKATGGKAQEGAWYGTQRYVGGKLLDPGQDQAGHNVSDAVIAQTNPNNVNYVHQQQANAGVPQNGVNSSGGDASGGMGGFGGSAPAVPHLQALYDTAYTNNPDAKAAQAAIAKLQGDLTVRTQARDKAVSDENDNPFYAEATRVGRVQKINDNYNNDSNTITGQLTTAQTNLSNIKAEAERQVNLAQGQYSLDNGAYKQNLDEFNTLLSAGGLNGASDSTLAQLSVSTGMPVSMLKGIQSSQSAKNTQIVTSTDNSGNLTVAAIDTTNGSIISTSTLGGVGKAAKGKSGAGGNVGDPNTNVNKSITSQFYQDIASSKQQKLNGISVGVYPQMIAKYANALSLPEINKLYLSSPQGQKWGKPKEDPAQIKEFYDSLKGKQAKQSIN